MTMLTADVLSALQMPRAHYQIDVEWRYLEAHIAREEEVGFEMVPEYQRGHVWSRAQQVAYVEHVVLGGETAREVIAVHVGDIHSYIVSDDGQTLTLPGYSMLDGLQRITAVRSFMRDEFPVLRSVQPDGFRWSQFAPSTRRLTLRFQWRVVTVPTAADILRLYLRINSAGTPHSEDELNKVRAMLAGREA